MRNIAFALLLMSGAVSAQSLPPLRIQNNGTSVRLRFKLNFTGGGCVDNTGTGATDCTIATAPKPIFFSLTDYAASHTVVTGNGSFTTGAGFAFTSPSTITGVRFYYPDTTSRSIKVSVWDSSGTRILTNTATYNTAGIKTVSFTPTAVVQANCFKLYYVGIWDTSGDNYIQVASAINVPNAATATTYIAGPNLIAQPSAFGSGDAIPGTPSANTYTVEPLFTTP